MNKLHWPLIGLVNRRMAQVLLVALSLVAVALRFWQLGGLPPGLNPDEAAIGLSGLKMLELHQFSLVYPGLGVQTGGVVYLAVLGIAAFGHTALGVRAGLALVSVLTVVVTYFWARDWFGRRPALIAGLLVAVSPWAITLGRDATAAGLVPLWLGLTAVVYTKAVQDSKRWKLVASGVVSGLGVYLHPMYWLVFLIAPPAALYLLMRRRGFLRQYGLKLSLSLGVTLVLAAPLGVWAARHHHSPVGFLTSPSVLTQHLSRGQLVKTLADHAAKTVLALFTQGDDSWRHNLSGAPLLNIFVALMLVLGILVALSRIKRPPYFLLLLCLVVFMVPAMLLNQGVPDAWQLAGVIPVVMILAAIGTNYLLQRWYSTFPINGVARNLGLAMILLLLGLTALQGYKQYFVAWAQSPEVYASSREDLAAISDYLVKADKKPVYYVVASLDDSQVMAYLSHKQASYTLVAPDGIDALPLVSQPKVFVFTKDTSVGGLARARLKYQKGRVTSQLSPFDLEPIFYTYETQ